MQVEDDPDDALGVVSFALEPDGELCVVSVGERAHGAGALVDGVEVEDELGLLALVAGGEVDAGESGLLLPMK